MIRGMEHRFCEKSYLAWRRETFYQGLECERGQGGMALH